MAASNKSKGAKSRKAVTAVAGGNKSPEKTDNGSSTENKSGTGTTKTQSAARPAIAEEHLPPLVLISTVLVCSGTLWVLGLRDMIATGRNILGSMDDAYLSFTKSTDWFDDSRGWKSTMGGLSTVKPFTTDANNMGGLFVRKVGGAAMLAVHLHKLYPLLFHPSGAEWKLGHFRPLLATAVFSNATLLVFYSLYLEDFTLAGADDLPKVIMGLLGFETVVMTGFMLWQRTKQSATQRRAPAVAMRDGKTPNSVPSRILCRTVALVSTLITLVAGRDLFFPGEIIPFFPRDDIYLEWTNAFLHSPPTGTPEATEQGLEAPLYIGDKFSSQLMAVHVLLLCLYKFVSTCIVRVGSDGAGYIQTKMMWAVSALGGAMVVGLFRLFTPAAQSASLDMRWHLMCMAYETFLFGLLAFW